MAFCLGVTHSHTVRLEDAPFLWYTDENLSRDCNDEHLARHGVRPHKWLCSIQAPSVPFPQAAKGRSIY